MPDTKVLLTGGTGFIGSHLAPLLIERGYDVYVLERYVTGRYVLGQLREIKTVFGDLREYSTIKRLISEIQPDFAIHLAAISPVAYSYERPQEVIEANFTGTVNLAEACMYEVPHFRRFLFASTSETYGNGPSPKREDTPQNPNSPYAVTKLACEKYLMFMRDAYKFPMTILRPFNTYGRKDNTHFVVERTIVQMLQSETVRLGDPKPVRDLLYINDHANAYLTCLENDKAVGEVFNFSTGRGVSIKQLVDIIREITDYEGEVIWNTIPPRPLDIIELIGDYTKAKKTLGWEPKIKLEDGLKRTVEFWKNKLSNS